MKIQYKDSKLKKCAEDERKCVKEMGKIRAEKFQRRLNNLDVAETLEDTRFLPGNYHELTGDRKGQWSCDLDQPYRLIFEPNVQPIPTKEDGGYDWKQITSVTIIEIVDYHKK